MELDTLALLRPANDAEDVVRIEVEGGKPLGILMDQSSSQALIKEFKRVGDEMGPIEKHPDLHVGAVLVSINGRDVSGLSLLEVGEILKKLKDRAKVLGWRVERQLKSIDLGPKPVSPRIASPKNAATPVHSTSSPPSSQSVAIDIQQSDSLQSAPLDPIPVSTTAVVRCPSGPLGLLLNSETPDRAMVIGFQPLADGSQGVLEMHGDIRLGSLLTHINGVDVSSWSLDAVKSRLGELADQERTLEFLLPRRRANSQDFDMRRKEEFTFMKLNDSVKIERGECWMIIDAKWVERWVTFAALNGPPPGPINNENLVEEGWLERVEGKIAGDADMPRKDLKLSVDYRCVTPLVWCFFTALHGTTKLPPIARYSMDIYGRQLPAVEMKKVLKGPALKAEVHVKEIKQRCET